MHRRLFWLLSAALIMTVCPVDAVDFSLNPTQAPSLGLSSGGGWSPAGQQTVIYQGTDTDRSTRSDFWNVAGDFLVPIGERWCVQGSLGAVFGHNRIDETRFAGTVSDVTSLGFSSTVTRFLTGDAESTNPDKGMSVSLYFAGALAIHPDYKTVVQGQNQSVEDTHARSFATLLAVGLPDGLNTWTIAGGAQRDSGDTNETTTSTASGILIYSGVASLGWRRYIPIQTLSIRTRDNPDRFPSVGFTGSGSVSWMGKQDIAFRTFQSSTDIASRKAGLTIEFRLPLSNRWSIRASVSEQWVYLHAPENSPLAGLRANTWQVSGQMGIRYFFL